MQQVHSLDRILTDLVAFQTVTGEHAAASACLDYAGDYLAGRGMTVERLEFGGFPSLIATTRPTKTPKLLLQAHIDVVAAPDSCFKLHEKDGKLFGRGVFDMKFAAAVFLKAVDELQGDPADYDFGIMLTSDEEIGGKDGVKALVDAGYGAEVCVLPDGGDNWRIETSHKGAWIGRLSASGTAAHGSRPWEGDNAIDRVVDALCDIRELFKEQHADGDTLSINMISGGSAVNQVADKAEVTLDVRCVNEATFRKLHSRIEKISAGYDISVETIAEVAISETDTNHPLVAAFLDIAREVRGEPLGKTRSLGTSDARFFANRGIPVILVRPDGGCAHADGEWIDKAGVEKYLQAVKAYVEAIASSSR